MLEDVGDSRIVRGVCLESNGKDIIAVFARNVQVVGAGLVVLKMQRCELELRNMLGSDERESVQLGARLRVLRQLGYGLAGRITQHGESR